MSLARQLATDDRYLLKLQYDFASICSDMQIWTFYETVNSQIAGGISGTPNEIQLSAPIVSAKSAVLGIRHEIVHAIANHHACCASFDLPDDHTMELYLSQLSKAIIKANRLSTMVWHTPLRLEMSVQVDVTGFYRSSEEQRDVMIYSAKFGLAEFLRKGPEECLKKQLSKRKKRHPGAEFPVSGIPRWARLLGTRRLDGSLQSSHGDRRPSDHPDQPEVIVTVPEAHGSNNRSTDRASSSFTWLFSNPSRRRSVSINITNENATVEKLASTTEDHLQESTDEDEPLHPNMNTDSLGNTVDETRPAVSNMKFLWVHLPYTNPSWVKVSSPSLTATYRLPRARMNRRHPNEKNNRAFSPPYRRLTK